eukprot:1154748-Pelagomonas_calceolata.AAC.4
MQGSKGKTGGIHTCSCFSMLLAPFKQFAIGRSFLFQAVLLWGTALLNYKACGVSLETLSGVADPFWS